METTCCCLSVTCLREQVITSWKLNEETADRSPQTEVIAYLTMMDIAVLEKQYNWIKEKQKLQTHVVFFRKGKEICGKSLISVVPISQEVNTSKAFDEQLTVREIQFNLPGDLDCDKTPWHAHLGMHRMTHVQNRTKATGEVRTDHSEYLGKPAPIETHSESVSPETVAEESPAILDVEFSGGEARKEGSRKFSAPAVLSRQLSVAVYQPSMASQSSQYYPFPQRKCPRKSEAARRLGMYSSF
uniref:TBC1 domain-containing protein n=1 Tax=Paramormyrops kingsleyae TaxID=1676925 RepID=A0A3B3RCD1_9TELE